MGGGSLDHQRRCDGMSGVPAKPCDGDCATCTATQDKLKTDADDAGKTALWGGLTDCPASDLIAAASKADQQTCLTQMAEAGMLQPLLKMYTCCVSDANHRSGGGSCAKTADKPDGCVAGGAAPEFPLPADGTDQYERATASNTCEDVSPLRDPRPCLWSTDLL